MKPSRYMKAIVGGVIAGLSALIPLAGDGISMVDALGAALAALVGFQGVYWTENAK